MQIESKVPKVFGRDYGPMKFEIPRSPHNFIVEQMILNNITITNINIVLAHAGWVKTKSGRLIWCFNDGQEVLDVIESMDVKPDLVVACSGSYFELTPDPLIRKLDDTIILPEATELLPNNVSFFYGVDPMVIVRDIWNYDHEQSTMEYLKLTFDPFGLIKRGKIALHFEM